MVKIYLDAGHGGTDGGAGAGTYLEKDRTLQIASRLNQYLTTNFDVHVVMSRTTDKSLSLSQRTNHANSERADFLLSIHYNAFNGSARGYEDFTWNGIDSTNETENIRNAIHNEVVARVLNKYAIPNRGRKKANFHMIRESNMPACLVETLFVDNAADQRLIVNNDYITDIVTAYGEGLGKGLGLRRKLIPVSAPTAPTTGKLYRVQCGAFGVRRNAEALETRLKNKGYPAFITSSNGLYRVQCGAFGNIENARNLERRLRADGFPVFIYQS